MWSQASTFPPAALTEALPEGVHVASLAPKPYDYDPFLMSGLRKLVELAFDEDPVADLFAQSISSALCFHLARSCGNQRMRTDRRSERALPSLAARRLADYVGSRLDARIGRCHVNRPGGRETILAVEV